MRPRLVAALVAVATASACTAHTTARTAVAAGVVTAGLGLMVAAAGDGPEPDDGAWSLRRDDAALASTGAAMVAVGALLALAGAVGLGRGSQAADDTEAVVAVTPSEDEVELDRATLVAYERARAGDCEGVRAIGAAVRARDSRYYRVQFAHDPLLAPCLAPR